MADAPAPTPDLILFDLDGTLIDSVPDLSDAVDAMLASLRLPIAGEERVRHWVGNGASMLVRRALAWALGGDDPAAVAQDLLAGAHQAFLAAYQHRFRNRTRLYPTVRDSLHRLHQRGIALAVVTNKPVQFVEPLLTHFELAPYIGLALGGDSLPAKKPDPLPLLHACAHFGASPARSLMVGDSRTDVDAARACGMPVVCVNYGYNHGEPIARAEPDRIIDSLARLL